MTKDTFHYLDFEQAIADVAQRIEELKALQLRGETLPEKNLDEEIERLELKNLRVLRRIYRNLDPWQQVLVSRHPKRPHASDFIYSLITDFQPLSGDRLFGEDAAMIAGIGRFAGQPVAVLGTDKGHSTRERMKKSFGMPKPEGYRKAKRVMELADRFNLPLLTFVDTPGAFPGVEAEARGQSEAIAACIETLLRIRVPVLAVITGEGGSGGALAVAVADRVLMLEHSVYSVISPEGCASILWRDAKAAPQAADALKMTAPYLKKMRVIDDIIKEPVGGAHRDVALVMERVQKTLKKHLNEVQKAEGPRVNARREKFLAISREL